MDRDAPVHTPDLRDDIHQAAILYKNAARYLSWGNLETAGEAEAILNLRVSFINPRFSRLQTSTARSHDPSGTAAGSEIVAVIGQQKRQGGGEGIFLR